MDGCAVSEAAWAPNIPFPSLETVSMLAYSSCARQYRPWATPVPSENTIRRGSSGSTLASTVESPDLGERDDLSEISVVNRPPFRRILSSARCVRERLCSALALENEELMAQGE